jgi:hypothetical protein
MDSILSSVLFLMSVGRGLARKRFGKLNPLLKHKMKNAVYLFAMPAWIRTLY